MSEKKPTKEPLYMKAWFWILVSTVSLSLTFAVYCAVTARLDEYFAYMFCFSSGLSIFGLLWLLFYLIRKKSVRAPLITLFSGIALIVISIAGFYYSVPELSGRGNLTANQRKNLDGYSKNELLESEKKESEKDDDYSEYYSSDDDTDEYTSDNSKESESSEKISAEYRAALKSAEYYANDMHMSKTGTYHQLTSDAGDKFPADAAQYAVDHVDADWKENALKTAKSYQKDMHMSNEAIRDQLTSDAGEEFTQEEADYAIQHLNN